jgi:DNA-binding NtrC family response regulator
VRELQNVIERAVVLAKGVILTPLDFPQTLQDDSSICVTVPGQDGNLTEILEDFERQLIIQTLRRHAESQTKTADVLGIKRTTLRYKMQKYGLV